MSKKNSKKLFKKFAKNSLSITKHILIGIYDLCDGLLEDFVNPYGTVWGRKPDYYNVYKDKQIYGAVNDLKRQNFIKEKKENGRTLYVLTKEGASEVKRQLIINKIRNKNEKWDGKWRIVIFDIPEDKRKLRNHFRDLLKELGFKMLQASVWAYPYKIFDELEELIPDIKKHSWIKLLLVEVIVGEKDFEKLFKI